MLPKPGISDFKFQISESNPEANEIQKDFSAKQ